MTSAVDTSQTTHAYPPWQNTAHGLQNSLPDDFNIPCHSLALAHSHHLDNIQYYQDPFPYASASPALTSPQDYIEGGWVLHPMEWQARAWDSLAQVATASENNLWASAQDGNFHSPVSSIPPTPSELQLSQSFTPATEGSAKKQTAHLAHAPSAPVSSKTSRRPKNKPTPKSLHGNQVEESQQTKKTQTQSQFVLAEEKQTTRKRRNTAKKPPGSSNKPNLTQDPLAPSLLPPMVAPLATFAYTTRISQVTTPRPMSLEHNRLSALRCRRKRRDYVKNLEETAASLERDYGRNMIAYRGLLDEVAEIKHLVMSHAMCRDPNIDCWIKFQAQNVTNTKCSSAKTTQKVIKKMRP